MTGATQALKNVVHQHALISLPGMQQRLFSAWFNNFVYNQIWEDPRVDLAALELQPESEVLTIASGGCNVLNYLLESPARIVAIDLNPYHLSLARLKIAAMRHLPDHRQFYTMFGKANKAANIAHFKDHIEPHLEPELADFWSGKRLIGAPRIEMFSEGFYRRTRFGYFMRFLHFIADKTNCQPETILQATTLEQQRAIYESDIKPFFDNKLVRLLGKLPMSVFSLGIPPQQYEAIKRDGNLVEQFRQRVERIACDFPIQENYFAWQGFSHRYDHKNRKAVPEYLKKDNYHKIKQQLNKVETHLGSMIDYLKSQPDNSLDRFVFLDAQDWMSDAVLKDLWQEVLRVGRVGTRIIFRTGGAASPLPQALPAAMLAQLDYHAEQSEALFKQDRSAIYGGFHLYQIKG